MNLTRIWKSVLTLGHVIATTFAISGDWRTRDGGIYYRNETKFEVKAISYFGFETCDYVVHGLWVNPLSFYLDFLQENKFNLIRLPFSEQWVKNSFTTQHPPNQWLTSADPSLQGMTSLQILDKFFDECAKRNIYILLDMHRLHCDNQNHHLWYSLDTDEFTTDTFFNSWQQMLNRYSHHPAFFALDLLNEPRDEASFGDNPSTSWNHFVESAFERLDYDGIYVVEGIVWGHDLSGVREHPIRVDPTRILYSPHLYGPSVLGPMNLDTTILRNEWDRTFGFLADEGKSILIGELGGRNTGDDHIWHEKAFAYLKEKNIPVAYWCLNFDSADTLGLVASDWTTPVEDKMSLLERFQPHPTVITPDLELPQFVTLPTNNTTQDWESHRHLRVRVC